MEFFTFASNTVLNVLQLRRPFLILSETDFCFDNVAIYILKCLIAGYGIRKVVPKTTTLALAVLNLWSYLLYHCELYEAIHAVLQFAVGMLCQFLLDDGLIGTIVMNAVVWVLFCLESKFHFFLDVYVVVTFFSYGLELYREERVKGCAMILYLGGISWFSSYYIGEEKVDMMHACVTVYLPMLLLSIFKPANRRKNRPFFYIVIFTCLYLFLKVREAALVNGLKEEIWTEPMKYSYNGLFRLMDFKESCKWTVEFFHNLINSMTTSRTE